MSSKGGRPPVKEPLVKPMHLRLSVRTNAYVELMALHWECRRQDAVRRIIAEHMESHS